MAYISKMKQEDFDILEEWCIQNYGGTFGSPCHLIYTINREVEITLPSEADIIMFRLKFGK